MLHRPEHPLRQGRPSQYSPALEVPQSLLQRGTLPMSDGTDLRNRLPPMGDGHGLSFANMANDLEEPRLCLVDRIVECHGANITGLVGYGHSARLEIRRGAFGCRCRPCWKGRCFIASSGKRLRSNVKEPPPQNCLLEGWAQLGSHSVPTFWFPKGANPAIDSRSPAIPLPRVAES